MLPKGADIIIRIFSVLIVVFLFRLRLNIEDSLEGSEVYISQCCGRYSACCGASILSAERNHSFDGGIERFGGWQDFEVAGAYDVQGPLWSISRTKLRITEKLEGCMDMSARNLLLVFNVSKDAWLVSKEVKQGKKPLERSFSRHFEVTSCPFKIHFRVAKVFTLCRSHNHFLLLCKKYIVSEAFSSIVLSGMECISTMDVYRQAKAKEEWVLAADQIFISGLGGDDGDMYRQMLYIMELTGLPIDKDAARQLFERRCAKRTEERGLKTAKDHFATQKQASFVIPLERPCRFSSNPLVTKNGRAEDEVFSIIYSVNDPEVEATRGFKYQRYVIQPWIPRTDETIVAGSLVTTSWNDVQSLADCYVTIYDELIGKLNAMIPMDVFQRVQIAACRLRCEGFGPSGKKNSKKKSHAGSWRPWGFKLLVACSEHQFSDTLVVQNAIRNFSPEGGKMVAMKGIKMFFLSGQEAITAPLEGEANRVKQEPWVILNGTFAPKLTAMLRTLSSVGVNIEDILSISHTRSYGQPGLHMMEHNHNILIRFKRLGAAIQLAQWWNELDISKTMSQLGRVIVIYGYNQAPLQNQIKEPQLRSPCTVDMALSKSEEADSDAKGCVTSGENRKHVLRNGKTYSQAVNPAVKRPAEAMESQGGDDDVALLHQTLDKSISATISKACRDQPVCAYEIMGQELCLWLEGFPLSQIGSDNGRMQQYQVLSSIAESFRSGAFMSALAALREGSTTEDMEIVNGNGRVGALPVSGYNESTGLGRPIDHDIVRSKDTPSDGACGYASVCLVIKHNRGELQMLHPEQYGLNIGRLAVDVKEISQLPEMRDLSRLRAKFRKVSSILCLPDWSSKLVARRDLWLTVAEVTVIMRAFNIPCREWMWTRDGFKCFVDDTKPAYDFCYHLMYYKGHFYIHSRTDVVKLSPKHACARPIPWLLQGGSIYIPCEGKAEDILDIWSLMTDHALQRSPHFCGIYPAIAEVTEYGKMRLRRGECRVEDALNYATTENVDKELMQFYWDNQGGNQWATVADHRIFNMCLACTTSKRHIPKGTNIAPVVGVVTTEIGSFSAVPCKDTIEEFKGMNTFLDPTPVGFDAGYNMFMDAIEIWTAQKLELNLSRYARIAWSSVLGITPNAEIVYTPGKATIWIRALVDIPPGEIIWVAPPMNLRFGMSPTTLFWNPPLPSFSQACHIPDYWEYIIVECLPASPDQPIKSEQLLSVTCANSTVIVDGVVVGWCLSRSLVESRWIQQCQQVSLGLKYWSRIFRNEMFFLRVFDKLIQRFIDYAIELLVLLESLLKDGMLLCNRPYVITAYCWSAAQCFGVEFSSDNAGDGPKRSFSQIEDESGYHHKCGSEWDMSLAQLERDDAREEIRIACWNSNGHLVSNDSLTIVELVQQLNLDVLMISDSRLNKRAARYHFKTMKKVLKGYSMIVHSTSRSSFTRGGGARMNTMGGTLFIISPRCATHIVDSGDDGSGIGIAGYVQAIIGGTRFCFISVYQPIGGEDAGESTVLSRLQAFLHRNRISDNPRTYILNMVSKWIASSRQKGFTPVVGGDFNMDPRLSTGSKLRLWSDENQLINVLSTAISVPYSTHMKKGQGVSCIDHVYVEQQLWSKVLRARVIQRPQLTAMSDHRVIYMAVAWQNGISHGVSASPLPPVRRVELRHYDSEMMQSYQEIMGSWAENNDLTMLDPSQGLAMVMNKSVAVTQELGSHAGGLSQRVGFRSPFKDGYSPCFLALKSAYLLILHYHQQLVSSCGSDSRYRESLHQTFIRLSHRWLKRYPFLDFSHDELLARVHDMGYMALCNIRLLAHISPNDLYDRAMGVRRLLHGRLRSEFRKRMSDKIKLMEEARQHGRLGYMFQMVNLREKQGLDLSVISVDGVRYTEPGVIHAKLTEHFADWYRIPEHLHVVAQGIYHGQAWCSLLDGTQEAVHGPESFRFDEFSEACQFKASLAQRELFRGYLLRPISDEEYAKEIANMKYGKAPGPSGATATMIKAWPAKIHELVLMWINKIWESKRVPEWWYYAHLRPIPKTGEATLDNLRPLGLYEISRKILTAIITRRIYNLWENNGLLDGAQHAFRRGRSTSQAIIRLVNTVEDTAERGIPQRLVQWDLRRAFDSVSFNFVRLALLRMGVPMEAVEFLVNMMENNVMSVASPYHLTSHVRSEGECLDAIFHQERGTGQGDPPSPVIWIAVFDILLSMLGKVPESGSLHVQGLAGNVYAARDIAYADDLATISSSLHHQQEKVDLVCTFCACTGMQIALAKVNSFAVNCPESCSNLVLHDSGWAAHVLAPTTGKIALKYLGFESDHVGGDQTAFLTTLSYVQMAASHLIHCHASREVKLLVYRMQIVPKVLYMASKACWTLEQYRQLDKYAAMILKNIGRQMQTSANSMMFFPADMCGSGLHPISDMAQTQKWGELSRALDTHGETSWAAHGLLERAMRQTVQQAPATQFRNLVDKNASHLKCFAGSLVEWGGEACCYLSHTPAYEYADGNKPILPYLGDGPEEDMLTIQLQQKDITVQGELVRRAFNGEVRWETDPTAILAKQVLGEYLNAAPSDEGVVLNNGQMYRLQDRVIEVIGVISDSAMVLCYEWRLVQKPPNVIVRSLLYNTSTIIIPWKDIVSEQIERIITMPMKGNRQSPGMVMRRIVSSTLCSPPRLGVPRIFCLPGYIQEFIEQVELCSHIHHCTYAIFTDGSHGISELLLQEVLYPRIQQGVRSTSTAALVALATCENWKELPCLVIYFDVEFSGITGMQACYAELLALIVAAHIQNNVIDTAIYSDCQGAIKSVDSVVQGSKRPGVCKIRPLVSTLCTIDSRPSITWVPSHPERRKQQSDWSYYDWGIFLADLAAGRQFEQLRSHVSAHVTRIPMMEVIRDMIMPDQWFWTAGRTDVPMLCSPVRLLAYNRVEQYLETRDKYRENRGEDAVWEGTALGLASRCWRSTVKGILGCNLILKNVLDKYWHGRNRAKGLAGIAAMQAVQCVSCGAEDSQVHIFLQCPLDELCELRTRARDELQKTANRVLSELQNDVMYEERVVQYILQNAFDISFTKVSRLWLGSWDASMLRCAICFGSEEHRVPYALNYAAAMSIQGVIVRLTEPLVKTVADMMRVRCAIKTVIDDGESRPRKRACRHEPFEHIAMQAVIPKPRPKTTRRGKKVGVMCRPTRRQEQVSRRRGVSVSQDKDHEDCRLSIDIVGYVSHPWGETQSCDYDKD